MDQFEIEEKLTSKRGFRGTVGSSLVVAIIASIVTPIVMLTTGGSDDSSDNGGIPPIALLPDEPIIQDKNSFEDSPTAGDAMEVGGNTGSFYGNSDVHLTTENTDLIVNTLTPNTLYYGGYSLEDYRLEQEFIDFQTVAVQELIASIETNIQNIEALPKLGNYPTMDEFNQGKLDVQTYLTSIDTIPTVTETIQKLFSDFDQTSYASDYGSMGILYSRTTTDLETEGVVFKDQITTGYSGDHTVTETQIDSDPQTLPEIYHYSIDVTESLNEYAKTVFDYVFDLVDDVIKQETFEQISSIGITYDQGLVKVSDLSNVISEYGTANVTISNGAPGGPDETRTNFDSNEEAGTIFPLGTDIDDSVEHFGGNFNYHQYAEYDYYFEDIFAIIINTLTPNTSYIGGYSERNYSNEQEFIDFQTYAFDTVTPLIEAGIEIIEGLPKLSDYPTQAEFNAGKNEVQTYLSGFTNSILEGYEVAKNVFIEFTTTTSYAEDFGVISATYLRSENGDGYQRAGFNGGITITQEQIETAPATLPEIYQFDNDVVGLIEEFYIKAFNYLNETFSYIVNEDGYNKLTNTELTYDEGLIRMENADYVFKNFGMTHLVA